MRRPADVRSRHLQAVESDYERRVDQWVTIYEGTSFHDWAIRVRLERSVMILDSLPIQGPVLDVGCGGGQLVALMARRGLRVLGTDLAAGMVRATNDRLATEGMSADVRQAGADDLPFDSAMFSVVTALGLIEYVDQPVRAVREMARVLAPGGHLIVSAPNPARLAYVMDPVGTVKGRLQTPPAGYRRHYWTPRTFGRLLVTSGLVVQKVEGHGVGPVTFAGKQMVSDARSIAWSAHLERSLPSRWSKWLGANLIAVATKP